mmetsp:Transcript_2932/g.6671  ORF Transcript_2932/g.6671 Transcript_2932/m.6671 type:complete len:203 (-) Transcript_2932:833-1441(-)
MEPKRQNPHRHLASTAQEDGVEGSLDSRREGELAGRVPGSGCEAEHEVCEGAVIKLDRDLVLEQILPPEPVLPQPLRDHLSIHQGPVVAAKPRPVSGHKTPRKCGKPPKRGSSVRVPPQPGQLLLCCGGARKEPALVEHGEPRSQQDKLKRDGCAKVKGEPVWRHRGKLGVVLPFLPFLVVFLGHVAVETAPHHPPTDKPLR